MWLVQAFEGYFSKDITFDIIANQAAYPTPADFWKVRLIERVYSSWTVPLRIFDRYDTANIIANTNFSNLYLPTYRFEGQNFILEPTPDTTITGGIRLEYIPQTVFLVLDTDTPQPGYLPQWEEPIILRAAISAKMKEESVVNSGTDLSSLSADLQTWEQNIKESMQQRSQQRRYTEPWGPDEGDSYYYP